jgi:hypothetical protein
MCCPYPSYSSGLYLLLRIHHPLHLWRIHLTHCVHRMNQNLVENHKRGGQRKCLSYRLRGGQFRSRLQELWIRFPNVSRWPVFWVANLSTNKWCQEIFQVRDQSRISGDVSFMFYVIPILTLFRERRIEIEQRGPGSRLRAPGSGHLASQWHWQNLLVVSLFRTAR